MIFLAESPSCGFSNVDTPRARVKLISMPLNHLLKLHVMPVQSHPIAATVPSYMATSLCLAVYMPLFNLNPTMAIISL